MTAAAVEHDVDRDIEAFNLEKFDFEIQCDIFRLKVSHKGMAPCLGDPARWIAWRANCCPESPRYRLVCDHCKRVYQKWVAMQAVITCTHCGAETGGFLTFTELKKQS